MSTDQTDDARMIDAAAQSAPPLTADTIDQLRRFLSPARPTAPPPTTTRRTPAQAPQVPDRRAA